MTHYTEGRKYSYISNAWVLDTSWNDQEEIASLRQQLQERERLLAEAQAREKAALRHLQTTSYHPDKDVLFSLFENLDFTAIDAAIKQAKREVLLEAANSLIDDHERFASGVILRRMAKELK